MVKRNVISKSKEVIFYPVLVRPKASPGVVYPHVESSAQKRHGTVGVNLDEGHKNDPKDGTSLLKG